MTRSCMTTFFMLLMGVSFNLACSNEQANFSSPGLATASSNDLSKLSTDGSANENIIKLEIAPNPVAVAVGFSQKLMANGVFANGQSRDVTAEVTWSVENTALAAIDAGEKGAVSLKGLASGTTKVLAKFNSLAATADVVITAAKSAKITLQLNGAHQNLTVPRRSLVKLSWVSEETTECAITNGKISYGNSFSGETMIRAEDAITIAATCKGRAGDTATDTLSLSATDPSVTFTINGLSTAQVLPKGSELNVEWDSENTNDCSFTADGAILGSGTKGVQTNILDASRTYAVRCTDTAGSSVSSSIDMRVTHAVSLEIAAGSADTIPSYIAKRPVALYFVLDVTGSMGGSIQTVKDNVNDLVVRLKSQGLSVRLAAVPFRDDASDSPAPFNPSEDVAAFKSYISGLSATGGGDANEGGLFGIQRALSMMAAQPAIPDEVKAIMVVSDNPIHVGTAAPRNCSLISTAAAFNALPSAEQKLLKIFYSGPTTGTACGGFSNLPQQMASLLSQSLQSETDVSKRGGQVPWPFSASGLVTSFTDMLVSTIPPVGLSCLDTKVSVSLNNAALFSWEAKDLKTVYDRFAANKPLSVPRVMSDEELAAFKSGSGRIEVTRCCVSSLAAAAGTGFDKCLKTLPSAAVGFNVAE